VNESECWFKCSYDSNKKCGGENRNAVYDLDTKKNKKGVTVRGPTKISDLIDVGFPNMKLSSLIVREARYDDNVVTLFEKASLGG